MESHQTSDSVFFYEAMKVDKSNTKPKGDKRTELSFYSEGGKHNFDPNKTEPPDIFRIKSYLRLTNY